VFFCMVFMFSPTRIYYRHQHRPNADVFRSISVLPVLLTVLISYSKAKLKAIVIKCLLV
jgi:hypothetical protein